MNQDKFTSPCPLPTPAEDEILKVLVEEASEVIKRAVKLQRSGRDEIQPGKQHSNRFRLSQEIGDFMGMVQIAIDAHLVLVDAVNEGWAHKADRFEKYRQHMDAERSPTAAALGEVAAYLREEADFNISFFDGRRQRSESEDYVARRKELATQREEWASAVDAAAELIDALKNAMVDLLPYAKTCVPNPTNVGEENVIAKAERLIQTTEDAA